MSTNEEKKGCTYEAREKPEYLSFFNDISIFAMPTQQILWCYNYEAIIT